MAQQTAVDIMFEKAISVLPLEFFYSKGILKETYQQAKEMFQQQIEAAWKNGDGEHDEVADELSKKYYNDTYGNNTKNK
jgi:hypothetical protein